MREILRLFKRFFVRLRFWKKRKKPVESTLTTQLKTFYDAELLGNAQAYSNWFAEECQVGVKPNGSLIHWNIFKPLPKQCVCCGEIIPEGRQYCPNCLVCVKDVSEDEHRSDRC